MAICAPYVVEIHPALIMIPFVTPGEPVSFQEVTYRVSILLKLSIASFVFN